MYVDFVGSNSKMTQAGLQSEILSLVWKWKDITS